MSYNVCFLIKPGTATQHQYLGIAEWMTMKVNVHFLPDNITIEANAGEPMLSVAQRAGIEIPTGCLMGSCHACEVELTDGEPVCACISAIPGDRPELTIHLYTEAVW